MLNAVKHQLAQTILSQAPRLSRHSLALVPDKLKHEAIRKVLELGLKPQLQQGEMDFLIDKWVKIEVLDIGLSFELSIKLELTSGQDADTRVLQLRSPRQADVTFSANVPELLLIASGKEDPDSMFFQRKLLIEGDTELGLEVKNLLLAIELDALPKFIRISLEKGSQGLEMLQSHSQVTAS
jgi:O2-independent ubiquinone biosynthesis accessory factor UbiT